MAFTAGITRPQNQGNSTQQQQNKIDRLLTITDYDTSKGYMYATHESGVKYEIFVNQEEVLRADADIKKKNLDVTKSSYLGHKIDEKMKKTMPVGSKVIVARSQVLEKDNGQGFKKTEVHRVIRVTEPELNKTYEGVFTANYRMDEGKKKAARFQDWVLNGINITNSESLENLKQKMDEAASYSGKKMGEFSVTLPTYGIQFRALMETDRKFSVDGTQIFEAVDFSLPFDWINGPLDESGKEIKQQAHPISGDEMISYAEQYIEYISNHEAFKDHIDKMTIEVCPYKVIPASNNDNMLLTKGDPEKDKNADKSPLYQLTHAVSFVDMEHSEIGKIVGRNNAVKGIIQITGDKLEKVNGSPVEVPTNWVNRIHAGNARGHVHAFVRTESGNKVEVHESLKLQRTNAPVQNNAPAPQQEPAQQRPQYSAPVAQAPVSAPAIPASDSDSDFDPFAEEAPKSVATPSAPVAAPVKALKFGAKKA